jgi:dihydrofolate synthase / folylpolyglutamate synthase
MMDFQESLNFLFNALPMFQSIGARAYKADLYNTIQLCEYLGNPQKRFKSIHVGGTNGKGSSSHAIAAVLQEAGYVTGLYTSPHLKSFTERIKINGLEIPENEVVDFVNLHQDYLSSSGLSFFEMTVGMAFWYFAKENVDIAIIEVGMGGRLDSTNIIQPEVALITNIGFDHMQFLGDSLEKIASEKAGIIKNNVPIVISQKQVETQHVFSSVASNRHANISFASDLIRVEKQKHSLNGHNIFKVITATKSFELVLDLNGDYQEKNLPGVLQVLEILRQQGWKIDFQNIKNGLSQIVSTTGLKGRWQVIYNQPLTICDTGHNEDGILWVLKQIARQKFDKLWIVLGLVKDKEVGKILGLLPKNAYYFFTAAKIPRALAAHELHDMSQEYGLVGEIETDVNQAIEKARRKASIEDMIFIGGSTFVVAEINNL